MAAARPCSRRASASCSASSATNSSCVVQRAAMRSMPVREPHTSTVPKLTPASDTGAPEDRHTSAWMCRTTDIIAARAHVLRSHCQQLFPLASNVAILTPADDSIIWMYSGTLDHWYVSERSTLSTVRARLGGGPAADSDSDSGSSTPIARSASVRIFTRRMSSTSSSGDSAPPPSPEPAAPPPSSPEPAAPPPSPAEPAATPAP